jgi:hypothetical protein
MMKTVDLTASIRDQALSVGLKVDAEAIPPRRGGGRAERAPSA